MIILRMKSVAEKREMLHKIKKMYKFAKELKDCFEEQLEDDYDDEDVDYREDMSDREMYRGSARGRYRRST